MRDKELYRQVLGLSAPWDITNVQLNNEAQEIVINIELTKEAILVCPHCNKPGPGYDTRIKRWRHLDTCQFHTILEAKLPRVDCQKPSKPIPLLRSAPLRTEHDTFASLSLKPPKGFDLPGDVTLTVVEHPSTCYDSFCLCAFENISHMQGRKVWPAL